MYYIYMLRCTDNSIYTGITTDLNRRISEHINKKGAKYTRNRTVIKIEVFFTTDCKKNASILEYHIKKLKKSEKEKVIINGLLSSPYLLKKIDINNYKEDVKC